MQVAEAPAPPPAQLAPPPPRRGGRGRCGGGRACTCAAGRLAVALRAALAPPCPDGCSGCGACGVRFLPNPHVAGAARAVMTAVTHYSCASPGAPAARRLAEDGAQSNFSLVFGETVVLKLLRRATPGPHPEAEMGARLSAAGFAAAAPMLGELIRAPAAGGGGQPTTVAVAHGFVPNQGDGWAWTQGWLARALLREAEARGGAAEADAAGAQEGAAGAGGGEGARPAWCDGYLPFARALGARLAQLHALLAAPADDPAFSPEAAGPAAVAAAAACALSELDAALALPAAAPLGTRRGAALRGAAARLASALRGAALTRVHGDFHLGQVLVVARGGDAVIVDFEGEPARPLAQRRAKASPLRDVASLLRSLDYAAAAAAGGAGGAKGGAPGAPGAAAGPCGAGRAALLAAWRAAAGEAVLGAYAAMRPLGPATASLIDLFLIERAACELRYEAANRSAWVPVPLAGLAALAERLA